MRVIDTADLTRSAGASLIEFEGRLFGAGVSVIIVSSDEPGVGPELHQHPYSETFLIHSGCAHFTVRGEQIVGVGGQIVTVPALTPHKFEVTGPDRLEMTDIHASDTFVTEWLEGQRADQQGHQA